MKTWATPSWLWLVLTGVHLGGIPFESGVIRAGIRLVTGILSHPDKAKSSLRR